MRNQFWSLQSAELWCHKKMTKARLPCVSNLDEARPVLCCDGLLRFLKSLTQSNPNYDSSSSTNPSSLAAGASKRAATTSPDLAGRYRSHPGFMLRRGTAVRAIWCRIHRHPTGRRRAESHRLRHAWRGRRFRSREGDPLRHELRWISLPNHLDPPDHLDHRLHHRLVLVGALLRCGARHPLQNDAASLIRNQGTLSIP